MQLRVDKAKASVSITRGALLPGELRRSAYRGVVLAGTFSAVGCPNKPGSAA